MDENNHQYFFGFSYWKHNFIKAFFKDKGNIKFVNPIFKKNYFKLAIKKGLNKNSVIYIWGKKEFPLIEKYANENKLKIFRVEDGFIRSVGLGSDLTTPYSIVLDSRGIYFDPSTVSDLEFILQNYNFDEKILERAIAIKNYLIKEKISKYNLYENIKLEIPKNKKIIVVIGQVEDDASIKYGAKGMSNLELLKIVNKKSDNSSYLIYKPHPDVITGNRIGNVENEVALKFVDKVVTEIGLDSVLEISDEVHTMTSLVGFEALIRGKEVFTYGIPFYSGWGLTNDSLRVARRSRKLYLEELIAGTLIIYPKYINPDKGVECEIEDVLDMLKHKKEILKNSLYQRIKMKIYNYISRKSQLILRIIMMKGL